MTLAQLSSPDATTYYTDGKAFWRMPDEGFGQINGSDGDGWNESLLTKADCEASAALTEIPESEAPEHT